MTQAFNLSQLANNLNSSGQLDATDGLTGLLPLANGGTGASNTVNTVVAGSGISVSTSGTQVTVTNTSSASGTVTSVATGNGLSGGTITTTGTLVVACPSVGSVGAYAFLRNVYTGNPEIAAGATVAGSSTRYTQVTTDAGAILADTGTPSGTWRNMLNGGWGYQCGTVSCRVS